MIRTLIAAGFLIVASAFDLRTRRVPNWWTLSAIPLYLALDIALPAGGVNWWIVSVNILTILIVLAQWLRREFGGADAKVLIALTVLLYWLPIAPVAMIFALTIAYTRRRRVARTRFIPWLTLGTAGALAVFWTITGTLP